MDLGVSRCKDTTYGAHPARVAAKAAKISGMILKAFSTRDPAVLWPAFRAYVLPVHVELCLSGLESIQSITH